MVISLSTEKEITKNIQIKIFTIRGGTFLHHRFTDISPIRHRLHSAENSADTKLIIFFLKTNANA